MSAFRKINKIIELLEAEFPSESPKPSKSDPLDVLIATMLSQNTTDKTSYRAFQNLKKDFDRWEDVMNAPLSRIRKAIKVCGLANQKAAAIKELLKQLNKEHRKFSLSFINKLRDEDIYAELGKHKGVGVKTISCVLAFGLGRDVFPVDTHVHRLCNRLGIANSKSANGTFEQMKDEIPNGKRFLFHFLLIRFGRKICTARNPKCSECVLYSLCSFVDKQYYADISSSSRVKPKENNFIILEHV